MGWSGGGDLMHLGVSKGLVKEGSGEIRRRCGEVDIAFQVASGCDATKSVLTKG